MRPVSVDEPDGGSRTLWFAETETTWDAYDVFYLRLDEPGVDVAAAGREGPDAVTRPTLPYAPPDHGWGHSGHPAIGITFHAAQKYCEWLSGKTGRRYRLPTAAEWAFVANETHCGGAVSMPPVGEQGWFAENAGGTTRPVATRAANCYGLFDLFGNVAEWCEAPGGTPAVHGGSFQTAWRDAGEAEFGRLYERLLDGERQTRKWSATDPSFPPSKWWLRDAPFVGFRVVCEGGPG